MEMVAAVKSVFARFAQFTGRAARPEFWWFQLGNWIILTVLSLLTRASGVFWVIYVIYALAVLIPSLAVSIRRLHDTDRTGVVVAHRADPARRLHHPDRVLGDGRHAGPEQVRPRPGTARRDLTQLSGSGWRCGGSRRTGGPCRRRTPAACRARVR